MLRARVLAIATLAVGASLAPSARASFGEPVEIARGSGGFNLAADADAAGLTTLLTSSGDRGARFYEHPAGGPWSAAPAPPRGPPGGAGGPLAPPGPGGPRGW